MLSIVIDGIFQSLYWATSAKVKTFISRFQNLGKTGIDNILETLYKVTFTNILKMVYKVTLPRVLKMLSKVCLYRQHYQNAGYSNLYNVFKMLFKVHHYRQCFHNIVYTSFLKPVRRQMVFMWPNTWKETYHNQNW